MTPQVRKIEEWLWEIPQDGAMRVPARIFATAPMYRIYAYA